MLIVLPYHAGDHAMALRLMQWIAELGGVKQHDCLLVPALTTDDRALRPIAEQAFRKVYTVQAWDDAKGWPGGPNMLFYMTAQVLASNHPRSPVPTQPWLWMEPDAVPMMPEWLDVIQRGYELLGKPFMGASVNVSGVANHLSGIAVYPGNAYNYSRKFAELIPADPTKPGQVPAFDVHLAEDFLPYAAFTELIQHEFWLSRNPDVEFHFQTEADYAKVSSKAVIFHRDKAGTLIERLRQRKPLLATTGQLRDGNGLPGEPATRACVPHETSARSIPIYTYFDPVPEIDGGDATALLEVWIREWHYAGWDPRVLSRADAKKHPLFPLYEKSVTAFPSVNPKDYEVACFLRWLAMAQIGGGWMCDYDVMPLNFPPRETTERITLHQINNPCPSLVSGSSREYDVVCIQFASYDPTPYDLGHAGGAHVSDQNILQQNPDWFAQSDIVRHYTSPGWQQAQAVHFANATMNGKQPKALWIPRILAQFKEPIVSADVTAKSVLMSVEPKDNSALTAAQQEINRLSAIIEKLTASRAVDRKPEKLKKPEKKKLTDEQRKAIGERLAAARWAKKKAVAA